MSIATSSTTTNIKINPEYAKLIYPLSNLEYEALKNSIKEDGLHYPIIVNEKGEILDGHHRYKICKDLDIPIKYEIKYFDDAIEEKKFVIDINLKRRQLNDFQKAELAYKLEDIYKEQARLRQLSKLKNVKDKLPSSSLGSNDHNENDNDEDPIIEEETKGRAVEVISKKNDLSPKTYQRAKKIIEEGSEEVKKRLRNNKTTISKEYEKIRKDKKRQELISQMNNNIGNNNLEINNVKLICSDFSKIGSETIHDNSIDLIFTDPPYSQEFLYLYEDLARLAVRVLKPGGSLVTYVGNISLTEIIKIFDSQQPDLKLWWQFVVKHNGGHQRIHARGIFARYKSLLWYVKGEKPNELLISNNIGDFIESSPPSKILHDWEQSPIESEYVIKNLTLENHSVVLDPMMGLGTTGVAAIMLNRKFIGIEKNEDTFNIAQSRITKEELAKKGVRKRGEKT